MDRIRLAVDLGTTTIETCLINTVLGNVIADRSFKNRQSLYGSDVINRILTATRDSKYEKLMKNMVAEDIASALTGMLEDTKLDSECIDRMCISGNTTMISILLEYDLASLGAAPFNHELSGSVKVFSRDIFGCNFPVACEVILSGCAGAFIGGDVLSGMVHLGSDSHCTFDEEHVSLLLDLGTNGEMVLNNNGVYFATSAACGPAFENCVKRQKAFGSSVIDAIALALKIGRISKTGVLEDAFIDKGLNIMGLHLDMDIIHQVLMAKAAIYTGIVYMTREAGVSYEDIDSVYLAGGFGFYINVDSAVEIGLLPKAFASKIVTVGNTSLKGACDILTSEAAFCRLEELTKDNKINILQLALRSEYQEELMGNMTFEAR